jgi:hypothetical protein
MGRIGRRNKEREMEKQKCAGTAYHAGRSYNCGRTGTLEHDGKMWCKTHHPPTVEAKTKALHAKWEAQYQARKENDRRQAIERELSKKALAWMREAYPACVAAWEAELEEKWKS